MYPPFKRFFLHSHFIYRKKSFSVSLRFKKEEKNLYILTTMGLRRRKKNKASVEVWARRVPFDFHVIVLSTRAVELLCHLGSQFAPVWVRRRDAVFSFVGNWCPHPPKRVLGAPAARIWSHTKHRNQIIVRTLPPPHWTERFGFLFLVFFFMLMRGSILSRRNRWFVKQMVVDLDRCCTPFLTQELASPLNARKSLCFFLFFWRGQNSVLVDGCTQNYFDGYCLIWFYSFWN